MRKALLDLLEVNINAPLTRERIITTLAVSMVMGILILLIYRITYRGVLFNRSFGTALLMVSLVTSLIIMPISSNIVLSLGMVGALSIVRFRTALKDPMDIVFMFWAIAAGLTTGAGFFELAILGCLILAVIMLLVTAVQTKGVRKPYLVVIRYTDQYQGDFDRLLPKYHLKSKTVTDHSYELVVEVKLRGRDTQFIDKLQKSEGILSASLVRYSGDYN
ncbi:MAG: DUF4956 domain-containing protein [Saccharofermentanales bacterium]|jgi:uncharacterized membrane protein YhiD involved in acid resistance|nr:DUF4956 domain-containing protein [Clostridiaceae bacterium]